MPRRGKERAGTAVIGGSGFYEMPEIRGLREVRVKTPFGDPSDAIFIGRLGGIPCAFLPRHGRGHWILPSQINSRANIYALKSLGVERIIAMGAVGSLKQELPPRHFVFPDQLVDKTKLRPSTFFGDGVVGHIAFADPFCPKLSQVLYEKAVELGLPAHWGGTYVCIEGPAFSTRAESEEHRRSGFSVIGMTALPESKLAREAEICYATVAMVTDYDVWKRGEEVSVEKVVQNLKANVENAKKLFRTVFPFLIQLDRDCACSTALRHAVFTQPRWRNKKTQQKLKLLT